jgi:hypothetical protein
VKPKFLVPLEVMDAVVTSDSEVLRNFPASNWSPESSVNGDTDNILAMDEDSEEWEDLDEEMPTPVYQQLRKFCSNCCPWNIIFQFKKYKLI